MNINRLSWRFLRRDWRAGELHLLVLALLIAVAATTAIGFFTDRLQRAMLYQSAELLGADLVLQSPRPLTDDLLAQARSRGLLETEVLEFPSVVLHGEFLQLSSIRAVEPGYPLRGTVRTTMTLDGEASATRDVPQPGEAWVEARILPLLQARIGDSFTLGHQVLRISRLLAFAPGGSVNFASLSPAILIRRTDAEGAGVLTAGSRVTHSVQFAGGTAALADFKRWLAPHLSPSVQLRDVHQGRPAVGTALDRTERYLGLAGLATVLLAGVAVAMGARRYSERHFDVSALLRCLGASQHELVGLYLRQLFLIGLLGSALGVALGYVAHLGLLLLLRNILPETLPPPGPWPALLGFFTGLMMLAGFALPPVLRLRQVPALRVLRRELRPLPLRAWLVYGAALAAMVLLLWRYTGNPALTFTVLGGTLAALVVFGGFAWALLRSCRGLVHGVGVSWRFGLHTLLRRPALAIGQILAFGTVLMAMALVALLRSDLLSTWQSQLPATAPNHFVINVLPDEVGPFGDFLRQHHILSTAIFPMVRGRLAAVNGVPVDRRPKSSGDETTRRELNLTWSTELPQDNTLVGGHWWTPQDSGQPEVSVEEGVATRLSIALGDVLTFDFGGGEPLTVTATSLRKVQWDSFRPNFFMMFPPGVIDRYPATDITSFYLPPADRTLMAQMVHQFPAVTDIDLAPLMDQVRQILAQVTLAVEYVLVGVLLAGFAVLFASLQSSLDERLYEGALLRTLGASRLQLRAGHLAEYALLGFLAGLFAAASAESIAWVLYTRVFHLTAHFHGSLWLLLPPIGALLVGTAGFWGTRRVVAQSPLVVLREL